MLFHTPQKRVQFPDIEIDGTKIEYVKEFNYLGIILDCNMTWKKHIEHISQKLCKISGVIRKLKHFLPQHTLLTIYNTLVLPHYNYGILLWGSKAGQLERLQRKIIRNIAGKKYNAHTDPIYKELKLLKVSHINVLNELKFCFKLEKQQLPCYFLKDIFIKNNQVHNYNTRGSKHYQKPQLKCEFFQTSLRF